MSLNEVKSIMRVKPSEEENDRGFINLTYGKDIVDLGFDENKRLTAASTGAPQIQKQGEKAAQQKKKNAKSRESSLKVQPNILELNHLKAFKTIQVRLKLLKMVTYYTFYGILVTISHSFYELMILQQILLMFTFIISMVIILKVVIYILEELLYRKKKYSLLLIGGNFLCHYLEIVKNV